MFGKCPYNDFDPCLDAPFLPRPGNHPAFAHLQCVREGNYVS